MKRFRIDEIDTNKNYRYTRYGDPNPKDNLCVFTVSCAKDNNRSPGEFRKFPLTSEKDTYLEIHTVDDTGRSHDYDYSVTSFLKEFIENPTVEESAALRIQRLVFTLKHCEVFESYILYKLLVELEI